MNNIKQILKTVAKEHPYKIPCHNETYSEYAEGWSDAINRVESMLSPPEYETGVWLTYTSIPQYMICKCSECGADILVPYLGNNVIFNFCPNCGAKMRGRTG